MGRLAWWIMVRREVSWKRMMPLLPPPMPHSQAFCGCQMRRLMRPCCCPLNSCTRWRRDQSWISTRDGPARPSTLPICPMPPTASCVPSGEKASERTPPIERIRCVPSQVYSEGAAIAGGKLGAVIGKGAAIKHRAEVRRRALLVAAQLADAFAAGDIPELALHIVGDAGDEGPVRGQCELANLTTMRVFDSP